MPENNDHTESTDMTDIYIGADWERYEPCPNCGQREEHGFRQAIQRHQEVRFTDEGNATFSNQNNITVHAIWCNNCDARVYDINE